ncbi:MAG: DUF4058 family protein [Armatimonadetes bacterium]|nr:DUF4058 family protein [Anaerolineae bacterium]
MQPVRSVKNQYRGINAHLHSLWQAAGGWGGFHTRHIVHLADALTEQLFSMGYVVRIEESLQIRRDDDSAVLRPRSDLSIYDSAPQRRSVPTGVTSEKLTGMVFPFALAMAEPDDDPISEKPYRALVIYQGVPPYDTSQTPVAWLELLSPSNKRRGDDAQIYRAKRSDLLDAGIVFVELDYLHELPPTLPIMAKYPKSIDANPYHILVFHPHPELASGYVSLNACAVDEPLPTVTIPLSGDDWLSFDFGAPYHQSIKQGVLGWHDVDYAQLPTHFERYAPADQARIARRMLATVQAAQSGVDLETASITPDESLSLEDALAQLAAFTSDTPEQP